MKVPFENLLKRLVQERKQVSSGAKSSFIKTDKQLTTILGVVFIISVAILFGYWFLKEKPYYEGLITGKDDIIEKLKFLRLKQEKIYENKIASLEKKLEESNTLSEKYVLKTVYEEKIKDYEQKVKDFEQKITEFQNHSVLKEDHEKQIEEIKQKLEEEHIAEKNNLEKEFDSKSSRLEKEIAILQNKNLNIKESLDDTLEFIKEEKESLESRLLSERKKALIPSLILPETESETIHNRSLHNLIILKDKLAEIEAMDIPLAPSAYFEMGLISYYEEQNKENNEKTDEQYTEAIEYWEKAVSFNRNDFKAYLCLAEVYTKEGMLDNAIIILKRAIDLNPKYAVLHLALARIYEQKINLDDAIFEYSKVLEIHPESIEILNTLGNLFEKKGMKEEAKKAFSKYAKLKKKNTLGKRNN